MRTLALVAHNIRSTYNVGSLLRTADGFEATVYLTGYTPYPAIKNDRRLPHLAAKLDRQIAKVSLGAEKNVSWRQSDDLMAVTTQLKAAGYTIAALEQTKNSVDLSTYRPPTKLALIVGSEIGGLSTEALKAADLSLQIPMFGKKESFNVSVAAAMALYHLKFAKPMEKR